MNNNQRITTMNTSKWGKSRLAKSMALLLVMSIVLAACGGPSKNNKAVEPLSRDAAASLKVAYTNEESYYMQYGNVYNAMFPNVEVEVVPTEGIWGAEDPAAELKKLMEEQKPDVISLTEEQYELLAMDGYLYDLDTVIKQDKFDIDNMMPGVIDLIKTLGGGKLYGLSPNFSSQALYYNKDMFDKNQIPYPTDQMSWEDILQLAERFPTQGKGEEQTYGLVLPGSSPFDLVETMGTAKGLTYVDYDSGQLSIQTDEWKAIFETVTNAYKSGKISYPINNIGGGSKGMVRQTGGNTFTINLGTMSFASGKAAMTIDQSFLMNMINISRRMGGSTRVIGGNVKGAIIAKPSSGDQGQQLIEIQDINWDLVTIPVDPTNPDVTNGLHLESVWSINAASDNVSPAWELIKYINGEQLAKTASKSSPQLTTRTAYINDEEHNLKAFTELRPNPLTFAQKFPSGFSSEFAELASAEIQKIISGTTTIPDALTVIQTQGQDLLTQKKLSEQQ